MPMRGRTALRRGGSALRAVGLLPVPVVGAGLWLLALGCAVLSSGGETPAVYLSDLAREGRLRSVQAWGSLGLDTSVVPPDGRMPGPVRIGEVTYSRGLGHHAGGEISVPLRASDRLFRTDVGVAWQGGGRGSVVFEVWVDDARRFQSGARSDSDPPVAVSVPVTGGTLLRLVCTDAGDGIGCDVAIWAEARIEQDPDAPLIGELQVLDEGGARVLPSADWCGLALVEAGEGCQVAVLRPARAVVAAVGPGAEVTMAAPLRSVRPFEVAAEVALHSGAAAEAVLALGEGVSRVQLRPGVARRVVLSLPPQDEGSALRLVSRGQGAGAAVRWQSLQLTDAAGTSWRVPLPGAPPPDPAVPTAVVSGLVPAMQELILEWDWRLQDGIDTPREPRAWGQACRRLLERTGALLEHLDREGQDVKEARAGAARFAAELEAPPAAGAAADSEGLWRRLHRWRRALLFEAA
ncbi:MAG: NPCBM/NEW2 domain-containing protein, partial [Lentisphaeria bacterium]|nr:NPCBM/NEW2 domain-containing protein [Lentisphaeria bacterium]